MKKVIFIFFLTLYAAALYGQVKVTGKVSDSKGKGLAGVNISVKNSYDGATSGADGSFLFETSESGNLTILFELTGYKPVEKLANTSTGKLENLEVVLEDDVEELKAAVVTAGAFEAGDKKRATTVLSSIDIFTTGGANADIGGAIKTLPGAQQLDDQEGIAVRGGSIYETKQFIDGTLVSDGYFAGAPGMPGRGRFSPVLFKGTVFTAGGYSALYGQALSSALILESIDLPTRSEASLSISPIFLETGIQQLAKSKSYSWGTSVGGTHVGPYYEVVKQNVNFFSAPKAYNGNANFRVRTKSGGMLKFYTMFSDHRFGVEQPNIDDEEFYNALSVKDVNWYNNLSWREYLGGSWKMDLGLSYSTTASTFEQQVVDKNGNPTVPEMNEGHTFDVDSRENFSQAKLVFEKKLPGLRAIRFGGEYWYSHNGISSTQYNGLVYDSYTAGFAETDLQFSNKLAVKLGVRAEYSSVISKWNIAPRASMAYKLGEGSQMSAAYGLFYQKPDDKDLHYSNDMGYQQAAHYIVNYNYTSLKRTLRLEAFYKAYDDLVKTYPSYSNDGSGYARGVELFWRDRYSTIRVLDYWLSYSYLDTKRDYRHYPKQLQPNFAANHTASLVVKMFIPQISTIISPTYTFASGRPYYDIRLDNDPVQKKYYIADEGKTTTYNSLNISVSHLTKVFGAYAVLYASVSNVLGQKHISDYTYSYNGSRKVAVTPTASRFYFIGLFLSWGVDRRQDVVDGNL